MVSGPKPTTNWVKMGRFRPMKLHPSSSEAASERRVILVDGFIASAAALIAVGLTPAAKDYMVFCHCSAENAHRAMLKSLAALPLLDLGLRLGEGTGALLAWPLVVSSARLLNEMASFESAGVAKKL